MGVCSSCLGRNRDRDVSDEDEQTRLLFDDAHANHYGSFGDHNPGAIQADPQEVQRETEALQKVVTMTSNHLVDIFAMIPQNAHLPSVPPSRTTAYPAQDARYTRYRDVLAKISATDASGKHSQLPTDLTPIVSDGWLSDDEEGEESKGYTPVKSDGIGRLLGGFADAELAMK
ncbi:hypothetical protein LZ554_007646 [Drepanopeziza brunnea f. sp. 'monogermtubi']|nr:hypothetical protein LZ554_007646 [Drepanopeziza brunnea f. sp. 'monogermtubi']